MMAAIGVREEGIVGEGKYTVCTKRYVRLQIWECQVNGGRGGVCMCTGMTNAIFYDNGDTDEDRYCTGKVRFEFA
jgi:hypothetical protein